MKVKVDVGLGVAVGVTGVSAMPHTGKCDVRHRVKGMHSTVSQRNIMYFFSAILLYNFFNLIRVSISTGDQTEEKQGEKSVEANFSAFPHTPKFTTFERSQLWDKSC